MTHKELVNRISATIIEIKEESPKVDIIKDYEMPTMFSMKTGKETGIAVVMQLTTKYEYCDNVFDKWKAKFGAYMYSIKVERTKLYITFRINYENEHPQPSFDEAQGTPEPSNH